MKIAALQMDIVWENPAANHAAVARFAGQAAAQGVDVLILPEMFSTGFTMSSQFLALYDDKPTVRFLQTTARQHQLHIIGGHIKKTDDGRLLNVVVVVDKEGSIVAEYAKRKLFSLASENDLFSPGAQPAICEIEGMRFGLFICYDLRFPELFRQIAKQTDVAVVLASWPLSRQRHWDILLQARAIENQQYVIGVNRVGQGGGIHYCGGSGVISPMGEVLLQEFDSSGLYNVTIERFVVEKTRREFPFLGDASL